MPKTEDKHTDIVWARIDAVIQLILENDRYMQAKRNGELNELVMEKFNVGLRVAQRYISEAKKEVRALAKMESKKSFAKCNRRFELLFAKALGVKDKNGFYTVAPDLRLARDINNDIAKMNQLIVEEIKHTGEVSSRITFVDNLDE